MYPFTFVCSHWKKMQHISFTSSNTDIEPLYAGNHFLLFFSSGPGLGIQDDIRKTLEKYVLLSQKNVDLHTYTWRYIGDQALIAIIIQYLHDVILRCQCMQVINIYMNYTYTSYMSPFYFSQGLDLEYKMLMTNGDEGDFWFRQFSADEFCKLSPTFSSHFKVCLKM